MGTNWTEIRLTVVETASVSLLLDIKMTSKIAACFQRHVPYNIFLSLTHYRVPVCAVDDGIQQMAKVKIQQRLLRKQQ